MSSNLSHSAPSFNLSYFFIFCRCPYRKIQKCCLFLCLCLFIFLCFSKRKPLLQIGCHVIYGHKSGYFILGNYMYSVIPSNKAFWTWNTKTSSLLIIRVPWMSLQHFMAINPIVVEIFLLEPKWWTDRQTDIALIRANPLKTHPWISSQSQWYIRINSRWAFSTDIQCCIDPFRRFICNLSAKSHRKWTTLTPMTHGDQILEC